MDTAKDARIHLEFWKKVGNPKPVRVVGRKDSQLYCWLEPSIGWVERGTGVPLVPGSHWVEIHENDEVFMVRVR